MYVNDRRLQKGSNQVLDDQVVRKSRGTWGVVRQRFWDGSGWCEVEKYILGRDHQLLVWILLACAFAFLPDTIFEFKGTSVPAS